MQKGLLVILVMMELVFTCHTWAENKIEDRIGQLENKLATAPDQEKIDILLNLASSTYSDDPIKCTGYCSQIFSLAERYNLPLIKADGLIFLSYAASISGDLDKPLQYSKEALSIYEKYHHQKGIVKSLNTIGYFYMKMNYFTMALDYLLASLKKQGSMEDSRGLYFSYWNLGHLYGNLEDSQTSLLYYQKALALVKDIKGSENLAAGCLHNIGLCYQELNNPNEALLFLRQGLALFQQTGDSFWIATCLSNMGHVLGIQGQFPEALTALGQSMVIRKQLNYAEGLFWTSYYTGEVYLKMKDYDSATFHLEQALNYANQMKDRKNAGMVCKDFAELYQNEGNYKKALDYFKKYSDSREWFFTQEKNRQISEMQARFEAEKKADEIILLKKDNKIQVLTRNTFIVGFLLVLVLLGVMFKKYLYLLAFWKRQKYMGGYRLMDKIGTGASSTVYRAISSTDKNRVMALKILKDELLEDPSTRQRFLQEGNIIDKLKHPNIVEIYERGEYQGHLYIALEYLEGISLAHEIKEKGRLALGESLSIMQQIAAALAFVHGKNVIHRDIKPSNILLIRKLEGTITVKLLDFGVSLAQFQTRLTQSGILVGTIQYTAPEQITANCYSPAGDVYALGATFYEMLVAESVFPGDTITAVVEKILEAEPKAPLTSRADLPVELNGLITHMLAKDPAQRPSATEVLHTLEKLQR